MSNNHPLNQEVETNNWIKPELKILSIIDETLAVTNSGPDGGNFS